MANKHSRKYSPTNLNLRRVLENPALAADKDLPKTGLSYEKEKALSASFIKTPLYGTRTSTVITIKNEQAEFSEKNYSPNAYEKNSSKSFMMTFS
jgi:uncharacterized protein with NRDE domain